MHNSYPLAIADKSDYRRDADKNDSNLIIILKLTH